MMREAGFSETMVLVYSYCNASRLKIKWFIFMVVGTLNPLGLFSIVHCEMCSLVGL